MIPVFQVSREIAPPVHRGSQPTLLAHWVCREDEGPADRRACHAAEERAERAGESGGGAAVRCSTKGASSGSESTYVGTGPPPDTDTDSDTETDTDVDAGPEDAGVYTTDLIVTPLTLEINQLKRDKNAVILTHSYVEPEIIYGVGDFKGDSYYLADMARLSKADVILFAGP